MQLNVRTGSGAVRVFTVFTKYLHSVSLVQPGFIAEKFMESKNLDQKGLLLAPIASESRLRECRLPRRRRCKEIWPLLKSKLRILLTCSTERPY